jgi:hypothetical protein
MQVQQIVGEKDGIGQRKRMRNIIGTLEVPSRAGDDSMSTREEFDVYAKITISSPKCKQNEIHIGL